MHTKTIPLSDQIDPILPPHFCETCLAPQNDFGIKKLIGIITKVLGLSTPLLPCWERFPKNLIIILVLPLQRIILWS